MDRSALLWTAAATLALVAVPLVFANALHVPTAGQNEEIGVGLFVLAAILSVVASALRGWRTRAGQVGIAAGLAVPVLFVVWLVVVSTSAPDHGRWRTVQFERAEPAPDGAPTLATHEVPEALLAALRAPQNGDRGWANLEPDEYAGFFQRVESLAPPQPPTPGSIVLVEGVAWRFTHGAVM